MKQQILKNVGIEVPNDFPFRSYENIHSYIVPQKDINRDIWLEFAGAWKSVAYKYITLAECDDIYSNSINQFGWGPEPKERFIQEKALFSFFINAHSLIESFCYALYILGSIKCPQNFLFDEKEMKNITPKKTCKKYNNSYESESITKIMMEIISSDEFFELTTMRNTIIHRTFFPGRHFFSSEDNVYWDGTTIQIDNQLTASRRKWLAKSIFQAMDSMEAFVSKYFSTP